MQHYQGDSTRLWVETTGVGHTWITTGEGDNQTVYSYGRYDDLNKDKDRLRGLTMSGEGVLLRLKGDEAKQYIEAKQATLFNNCTTKSIQAINTVGSTFFQNSYIPSPNGRGYAITTYKTIISPMALYLYLKK